MKLQHNVCNVIFSPDLVTLYVSFRTPCTRNLKSDFIFGFPMVKLVQVPIFPKIFRFWLSKTYKNQLDNFFWDTLYIFIQNPPIFECCRDFVFGPIETICLFAKIRLILLIWGHFGPPEDQIWGPIFMGTNIQVVMFTYAIPVQFLTAEENGIFAF